MEAEILLGSFAMSGISQKATRLTILKIWVKDDKTYKVAYHSLESLFGNGLMKGVLNGGQLIKKSLESSSISI